MPQRQKFGGIPLVRTLNELRPGESARVRGLLPDDGRNIVSRLMDPRQCTLLQFMGSDIRRRKA